ncbi:transcriptional regulator FixK [Rhodovulum sp. PH10]|nr:transcriptional regulator FixK [Rhodovulum sp. PH10]
MHIVEDDPGVSDSLAVLLDNLGFEVVCHADAEDFFRAAPPSGRDVVFVDLILPGISGAEVIRWLAKLDDPPRIVAMSGQSQATIDLQMRGLGPKAHVIRKPLNHAAISAQLSAIRI